uniref:Cyclin-dependent kinase inhibitor n=1 Tax=Fagus sylvatica TaxID=28930 RepID=A0A2N9HU62_FAGSY
MGDCVRNCKRISVVEGSGSSTSMAVSKKRRIIGLTSSDLELGENCLCVDSPVKTVSPANSGAENAGDLCRSFCTDQFPVSCCSSNESSEVVRESLRLIDLEAKSFETVDSTYINNNKFRETTPSSELCGDSYAMDSLETKPSAANHRRIVPKEEIEDFFAAAEKHEQKRFAEKYNYDIVKDVPLEGRYHWIRLKP